MTLWDLLAKILESKKLWRRCMALLLVLFALLGAIAILTLPAEVMQAVVTAWAGR